MQNTKNYGLRKPEARDFYDVEDQNTNMDLIDEKLKEIDDGKLSLDGGELTGELGVLYSNGSRIRIYVEGGNAQFALNEGDDVNNQTSLVIASKSQVDMCNRLALLDVKDGKVVGYYHIYGDHNKPTPEAIGALPITGGTVTGTTVFTGGCGGAEGGEILLKQPETATSFNDYITIDIYGDYFRILSTHNNLVKTFDVDFNSMASGGNIALHTGNSAIVVISDTEPTDKTVLWIS